MMKTELHFWELAPDTYFRLSDHFWGYVLLFKDELRLSWKKLKEKANIDFGNLDEYATSKQMIPPPNLLKLQAFLCSHFEVLVDASLPNLYMSLSDENQSQIKIVATMLRWLFSGDGWITVFKDHLGQTHRVIGIAFSKCVNDPTDKCPPRLLHQTIYLLKKFFGIQVNGPYMDKIRSCMTPIGKRTTVGWKIFIRGYYNLKKFYENIGFVEKRRNELLKSVLNTYERPKLGNGESLETVFEIAKNMKCVTAPDIAKRTKLSLSRAERLLKLGMKGGYLTTAYERNRLRGGGMSAYVYKWAGD